MRLQLVRHGSLRGWVVWALVIAPLVIVLSSLLFGRYVVAPADVFATLLSRLGGPPVEPQLDTVVFGLRVPRAFLAAIVGAGLATAGAAFQSLFSNPLATPDTLGVTAGASVGAVIGLMLSLPLVGVQLISLLTGITAMQVTLLIGRKHGRSSIVMLVLAGVVVAALANAVLSLLKLVADPNDQLPQITYWLMGSMATSDAATLSVGAPLIAAGIIIILLLRWRLNVLALGDDEARAAGMNVVFTRILIILAATLVTAASVSMCGQVGWVGLLVPHAARMVCGSNMRLVVPVGIAMGAGFVVVIDTLARSVLASEIPISVLTAFVGAPIFVSLLRRTGGGWT